MNDTICDHCNIQLPDPVTRYMDHDDDDRPTLCSNCWWEARQARELDGESEEAVIRETIKDIDEDISILEREKSGAEDELWRLKRKGRQA